MLLREALPSELFCDLQFQRTPIASRRSKISRSCEKSPYLRRGDEKAVLQKDRDAGRSWLPRGKLARAAWLPPLRPVILPAAARQGVLRPVRLLAASRILTGRESTVSVHEISRGSVSVTGEACTSGRSFAAGPHRASRRVTALILAPRGHTDPVQQDTNEEADVEAREDSATRGRSHGENRRGRSLWRIVDDWSKDQRKGSTES